MTAFPVRNATTIIVWPLFKREICVHHVVRSFGEDSDGQKLCQTKARPRLHCASQYKVVFYLPPLDNNFNVKL